MTISKEESDNAKDPQKRMLTLDQLPTHSRAIYKIDEVGQQAFGHGSTAHPFTTKRASSVGDSTPVGKLPWRATGKLLMKSGSSTFVCTASVIGKNLLVTAAHCVHEFGQGQAGFVDAVTFEPARHEGSRPFGTWTATQWWIPTAYFDGTDTCTASGIVCENDVAVVVLKELNGQSIEQAIGGKYEVVPDGDWGYPNFLNQRAAQITQMGYPARNFDGDKMIRTDSLGYWDTPSNVVIGSNQTGGSSGGPWIMNFGVDTSFTGTTPLANTANTVVATTSWGFTDDRIKIQGASRFSTNNAYSTKSNIESLIESACNANPGAC